jgi:hypothetical protein
MLKPLVSSLLFFLLARSSTAQFAAYPSCVQSILTDSFPAVCLSDSLAAQNTCLCKAANAAGNAFVQTIAQKCGCADLTQTIQLVNAYCAQVGIDTGPAFEVFVQDDTSCSTGGGAGATSTVGNNAATGTAVVVVPTSTQGSSGGDTNTQGSGSATVTVTAAVPGSTSTASPKSSDANRGLIIREIVGIGIGVITGGMLALW